MEKDSIPETNSKSKPEAGNQRNQRNQRSSLSRKNL